MQVMCHKLHMMLHMYVECSKYAVALWLASLPAVWCASVHCYIKARLLPPPLDNPSNSRIPLIDPEACCPLTVKKFVLKLQPVLFPGSTMQLLVDVWWEELVWGILNVVLRGIRPYDSSSWQPDAVGTLMALLHILLPESVKLLPDILVARHHTEQILGRQGAPSNQGTPVANDAHLLGAPVSPCLERPASAAAKETGVQQVVEGGNCWNCNIRLATTATTARAGIRRRVLIFHVPLFLGEQHIAHYSCSCKLDQANLKPTAGKQALSTAVKTICSC